MYERINKQEGFYAKAKKVAITALVLYAIGGNCYNVANKTGHPSADVYLGLSKLTSIEKMLLKNIGYKEKIIQHSNI